MIKQVVNKPTVSANSVYLKIKTKRELTQGTRKLYMQNNVSTTVWVTFLMYTFGGQGISKYN